MNNKEYNMIIIRGGEPIDPKMDTFLIHDLLEKDYTQHDKIYTFEQLIETIQQKYFTEISIEAEKINGAALAMLLNFLTTLDCKLVKNRPKNSDYDTVFDTSTSSIPYPPILKLLKE